MSFSRIHFFVLFAAAFWPSSNQAPLHAQLANLVYDLPEIEDLNRSPSVAYSDGEAAFVQSDGVLWRTDTTPSGTRPILDRVDRLIAFGTTGLWVRRGTDLWWSNGLPGSAGVHRRLGPISDSDEGVLVVGDTLFLLTRFASEALVMATPGTFERGGGGRLPFEGQVAATAERYVYADSAGEVWASDGTASGTSAILATSAIEQIVATNAYVYIRGLNDAGPRLWRSDGTMAGAVDLTDLLPPGAELDSLNAYEDRMCARLVLEAGNDVICMDDNQTSPTRVTNLAGTNRTVDQLVQPTSGGVYYVVEDTNEVHTMRYRPDGASGDGIDLFFMCNDCHVSNDLVKTVDGENLLLFVQDAFEALWVSDSTPTGSTRLVEDCFECLELGEDGSIYFVGLEAGSFRTQLVRFDFTTGAEVLPADFPGLSAIFEGSAAAVTRDFILWPTFFDETYSLDLSTMERGELTGLSTDFDQFRQLIPGPPGDQLLVYSRENRPLATLLTSATGIPARFLPQTVDDCRGPSFRSGERMLSNCGFDLRSYDLQGGPPEIYSTPNRSQGLEALDNQRFVFTMGGGLYSTDIALDDVQSLAAPDQSSIAMKRIGNKVVAVQSGFSFEVFRIIETDGTVAGTQTIDVSTDLSLWNARWDVTDQWVILNRRTDGGPVRVHRVTGEIQELPSAVGGLQYSGSRPIAHDSHTSLFYSSEDLQTVRRYVLDDNGLFLPNPTNVPRVLDSSLDAEAQTLGGDLVVADSDRIYVLEASGEIEELEMAFADDYVFTEGRIFFGHHAAGRGSELWSIDANQGLHLVHDLWPGPPSSAPQSLVLNGDRLYFIADDGIHGREVWSLALDRQGCEPHENVLCLRDRRFKVESAWWSFSDTRGRGVAADLTADTGAFWFFDSSNLETLVKVLDARGINEHFWTFLASLTNVRFELTVTDSGTGRAIRYANAPGNFASLGDTRSLSAQEQSRSSNVRRLIPGEFRQVSSTPTGDTSPCLAGPDRLCLGEGRFELNVRYRDFSGHSGIGTSVEVTDDTGAFWFFDQDNLELAIKVLDAQEVNGRYWVFYGALSNVAFTIRVRDTATGDVRTYENGLGTFGSVGDTEGFPAIP